MGLLEEVEPGSYRCTRCGWTRRSRFPIEKVHHLCSDHPDRVMMRQWRQKREYGDMANMLSVGMPVSGAGDQLHRIIKRWTGEDIEAGCQCRSRIVEMNVRGPQWCRENVERIVNWLIEEIERRLTRAKENGKRSRWWLRIGGMGLPGRRAVLRRMVFLAVGRAERDIEKQ